MEKNNKTELTHLTKKKTKQELKSSVKNEQKFGKLFNTEIKNGKKQTKIGYFCFIMNGKLCHMC